jgi:predicted SnoaL-like aldol condensation-catalyzing enzyme
MKIRTTALVVASVLASFAVLAQEPVVGVKDPESLFKDKDPVLNKNKQATLHIMRELIQCGQWDRAGEWLTPAYHQHNPNAVSGIDGVVYFFAKVMKQKRVDTCPVLTNPVVLVVAEGDLVNVMIPRVLDDPRNPGKKYSTAWFDTWRFVNGKADEHWDGDTIAPPPPPPPPKQ